MDQDLTLISQNIVNIGLQVVNLSLDEHPIEDALLQKFSEQFEIDKKEQDEDINEAFLLHIEKSVRAIHRNGKHLWFITYDLNIIGYVTVMWQTWPVKRSCFISDFFIDKPYRGQGLGRIALDTIISKLFKLYPDTERVGLSVLTKNEIAKSLYTSFGFSPRLETMVLEKPGFLKESLNLPERSSTG